MNEVEISLHDAILTRLSVDGDVGIIKKDRFPVMLEREVVLINGCRGTITKVDMPVSSFHINDIDIVFLLVEKGIKSLCRAQGNVVFR